jgi:hypothetical protein
MFQGKGDTAEPLIVETICHSATVWAKLIDNNGSELPNAIGFKGTGNWGWYNGPLTQGNTYTFEIWAGAAKNDTSKGMLVGELTVTYGTDGMVSWATELADDVQAQNGAHVYIGTNNMAPDFPKDFIKNVALNDSMGPYTGEIYFAFHSSLLIPES